METLKLKKAEKKEVKEFVKTFTSTVLVGNDKEINSEISKGFSVKNIVSQIFSERGECFVSTTVVFVEREV